MLITTANLSVLSEAVNYRFNQGMERAVTPWQFLAMELPSSTSKEIYPYFKDMGVIREWLGDRQIQNLEAGLFEIPNKDFEATYSLKRTSIEDDTYRFYLPMIEQTGQDAASFPAERIYGLLKAGFTTLGPDGQYFFDTDHLVNGATVSNTGGGSGEPWFIVDANKVYKPVIWQPRKAFELVRKFDPSDDNVFYQNEYVWGVDGRSGVGFSPFWQLAYGSKSTLDATNVKAALTMLSSQKGNSGKPLSIMGSHLITGPANAEAARDLMGKEFLSGGESNTMRGRLQVVIAPELLA